MIHHDLIQLHDRELLKKCVIFYRAIGTSDRLYEFPQLEPMEQISFKKVKTRLLSMLRKKESVDPLAMRMRVHRFLEQLLELEINEKEYISNFSKGTMFLNFFLRVST